MRKLQVTIDDRTARLLDDLAAPRAGNRSFVIREAIKRMSAQDGFERYLDWLEEQPGVRTTPGRALADEQAGRTASHAQALKRARRRA
jgi:predicted transcriptional regulator